MKTFIRVNSENKVVCRATEKCNLHGDGNDFFVDNDALPGDDFIFDKAIEKDQDILDEKGEIISTEKVKDYDVGTVTKRPENYPQPSQTEIENALINERMKKIAKDQLISEGVIVEKIITK